MVYSATQLAKKLDISRSYLYYLKDNGVIEFDTNDSGKVIWDENVFFKLQDYINKNNNKKVARKTKTAKEYKTININNRRYLGNKYKLIPFITHQSLFLR